MVNDGFHRPLSHHLILSKFHLVTSYLPDHQHHPDQVLPLHLEKVKQSLVLHSKFTKTNYFPFNVRNSPVFRLTSPSSLLKTLSGSHFALSVQYKGKILQSDSAELQIILFLERVSEPTSFCTLLYSSASSPPRSSLLLLPTVRRKKSWLRLLQHVVFPEKQNNSRMKPDVFVGTLEKAFPCK